MQSNFACHYSDCTGQVNKLANYYLWKFPIPARTDEIKYNRICVFVEKLA